MKIAMCYENVQPFRGGCATYISDLARRLARDGHEIHLFACSWDAAALPSAMHYHKLPWPRGPRFLRPWRFSAACRRALADFGPGASIGFDKTRGQDVLYPQGGLHIASFDHNLIKFPHMPMRHLVRFIKQFDPAHQSFSIFERRQYLHSPRPLIVVNSQLVRRHFETYYGVDPHTIRVIRSAIDPNRFQDDDREERRTEWRTQWGIQPDETVGLFVAINYRLKGLEPLLHAVQRLGREARFRLVVVGREQNQGYQRLAERLGVARQVYFAGHCPDMRNAYFAADFLVHPTFYDPCSLVVLEGLACGLPIITSQYNGARELLSPPREGYVIQDPHDHGELADALWQLLDPERRQAQSRAARARAEQWTFEHHYRELLSVFQDACQQKRAA